MQAYRALIADIYRTFGWRIYAVIGWMALVGITEGFAVALLLPLLSRLGIAGPIAPTKIAQFFEVIFSLIHPNAGVWVVLTVLILIAIVQFALSVALNWYMAYITRRYAALWQGRLFAAILNADWPFITEHKIGEFSNAIIVETARVTGALQTLLLFASSGIVATIYLLFAFMVSWQAAALLIIAALVMGLVVVRLYKTTRVVGRRIGPINAALQVHVHEYLTGAKIVKATSSEGRAIERVTAVLKNLENTVRKELFVPVFVRLALEFMAFVALAGFLVFGVEILHAPGANLLVVLALFMRLLPRFATVQVLIHNLNTRAPAILDVNKLLAAAEARREQPTLGAGALAIQAPTNVTVCGLNVAFKENLVLRDLNATFPIPGMIGIVGGSGAGKSTLIHALLGLVRPSSGTIHFGSYDIKDVAPATWRLRIGYVPQETLLFHASVRENISLSNPEAAPEDVTAAAKRAHAHDFIMALPKGYDTEIGDQGVLLSGGQRQRLGIARALLSNPLLLLMDEPTSALDSETEQEILATLEELRTTVGIIIVAHRLSTIRNADRICVMDMGRILPKSSGAF